MPAAAEKDGEDIATDYRLQRPTMEGLKSAGRTRDMPALCALAVTLPVAGGSFKTILRCVTNRPGVKLSGNLLPIHNVVPPLDSPPLWTAAASKA